MKSHPPSRRPASRSFPRTRRLSFESLEVRTPLAADMQGVALAATDSAVWGDTINVQGQVRNAGDVGTGTFLVQFYLSKDTVGTNDDIRLIRPDLSTYYNHPALAAGATGASFSVDLKLPTSLPAGFTGGNFYILMRVDATNRVIEYFENNNFGQLGTGIDRDPIVITAPDIAVSSGGVNIADGDSTPSTADGTNFGSAQQGSAGVTRTFTVQNAGTGVLTLGPVALPAGYTLVEGLASSLAAGASDTFTVRLDTLTTGLKRGIFSIASNDANETPFNFTVTGNVTRAQPEIVVSFGAQNIVDGDTTPSTLEGTDFGSVLQGGAPVSRTFTVSNTGNAPLTLNYITVPLGFVLTEGLPSSLAPGASDTFTVELTTASLSNRAGLIRVRSNDASESIFDFRVVGSIIPAVPEITVEFSGNNIADGDTTPTSGDGTDFGTAQRGDPPVSHTFTVRNDGTGALTLGNLVAPAGFTVTEGLSSSLAPGASDSFTVQLDTTAAGNPTGQISIASNDANENPFNFAIRGSVVAPEIAVLFVSQGIADGDSSPSVAEGTDFGEVIVGGTPATRTFTVRNDGPGVLTLGAVALPAGYTLAEGLASSLAPGASDTFTVQLDTASLGTKSGEISIGTNDADENPFNFSITGIVGPGLIDLSGASLTVPASTAWGKSITVQAQVQNSGIGPSGAFEIQWYLSRDPAGSTASDVLLTQTIATGGAKSYSHASIGPGSAGPTFSVDLQLPVFPPSTWAAGNYYIVMRVDSADQISETLENNNFGEVGSGLDHAIVTIAETPTFELHSLPGATKRIYLDFDGHTIIGTSWNTHYNQTTLVALPYDIDGVAGFSATEIARIEEAWKRIAEDFMPFNVDVTTQDPGVEALRNLGMGDNEWGIRVVVTDEDTMVTDPNERTGVGGRAYYDSFTWSSDTPAVVYTTTASSIADVGSHEVGHSLGLTHDGENTTPIDEYYNGHGTGPTTWSPIMGNHTALSQWDKGQYPLAVNNYKDNNDVVQITRDVNGVEVKDDDLAVITDTAFGFFDNPATAIPNGFGYRADDHSGNRATASNLLLDSSTLLLGSGIIERSHESGAGNDEDYFRFEVATPGTVVINVDPVAFGPNLDILIGLFNDISMTPIATSNPVNALNATITQATLAAGTYYLAVDGIGKDTPLTNGYSDYGSLGFYSIEITGSGGASFAPSPTGAPFTFVPVSHASDLAAIAVGGGDARGPIALIAAASALDAEGSAALIVLPSSSPKAPQPSSARVQPRATLVNATSRIDWALLRDLDWGDTAPVRELRVHGASISSDAAVGDDGRAAAIDAVLQQWSDALAFVV